MKITCKACGHENELGRIFCSDCGKKLDMSQMSMEQVSQSSGGMRALAVFKWIGIVFLLLLLLGGALAFWPRTPFQEGAAAAGANRVRSQLQGVQTTLRAGGSTTVTLAQRDLNAYLESYRGRARLLSLTVDVRSGAMVLRATDQWGPFEVGTLSLGPLTYSYDVRVVPAGDGYRLAGKSLGHLPLPGPLGRPVHSRLGEVFQAAQVERELVNQLEMVEFEHELVKLAFRP